MSNVNQPLFSPNFQKILTDLCMEVLSMIYGNISGGQDKKQL